MSGIIAPASAFELPEPSELQPLPESAWQLQPRLPRDDELLSGFRHRTRRQELVADAELRGAQAEVCTMGELPA